ncbi:MAG TPA: MFS transporter [Alphaproteobacteria bacterium]|nr:MFS transporter [Alphaproteobacteria bacterium]
MRLMPPSAGLPARLVLVTRGLRGLADGCIAVLLPAYLLLLGFDAFEIGVLTTATLLGSAALTLLVGLKAHARSLRLLLIATGCLMAATGAGFAFVRDFAPLLVVAFVGTLNPSSGDVSVFLPLEHSVLSRAIADADRTDLFARYSLVGSLCGAFGTLLAALPDWVARISEVGRLEAFRAVFLLYGAIGIAAAAIYRGLPKERARVENGGSAPKPAGLGPSRPIVLRLAALFSVDSFAGGLVTQSLLVLWLFEWFDLSVAAAAEILFWMGLLASISYLLAARIAARIGLIRTMVFTHLPASFCLAALPFAPSLWVAVALLLVRGLFSSMDVPARSSYVMAVVTPEERPAAASITAVPRSLAAAIGPSIGGFLLTVSPFGWPFLAGGALKAAYDLTLLGMFRNVRPPEEKP